MARNDEYVMLSYLMDNPGWHMVNEIALYLNCSSRTVKNYYQRLSKTGLISSSRKGYRYCENVKMTNIINKDTYPINEQYIFLNKLISSQNGECNIFDLSEDMHLSESVIRKIANHAQSYAEKFNVKVITEGDNYKVLGFENDKRHLLSDMIYKENAGSFLDQSTIQNYFPNIEVGKLSRVIRDCFLDADVYINSFYLNNIVLHVSIAIERLKEGNHTSEQYHEIPNICVSSKILGRIEAEWNISFSREDKAFLSMVIEDSIPSYKTNSSQYIVPKEYLPLIKNIVKFIDNTYKIRLDSSGFFNQLEIHIVRLIHRLNENNILHNPLCKNIKESSPTTYECAVLISNQISRFTNKKIPDSEIAYIAMHVGNVIAEQIADSQKIKVTVLSPDYQNQSAIIANKIISAFSELNILAVVSNDGDVPIESELVISVGMRFSLQIPCVNVSFFLTDGDLFKIRTKISEVRSLREQRSFDKNLSSFFDSTLFKIEELRKDRNEVLKFISREFCQKGITPNDYFDKVLEREKMSSTAFGNIAIPHALKMEAFKTKAYIYINKKGIKWENNTVYLVIALAFSSNDEKLFRNFFDRLSDVMTDESNISNLTKVTSYVEFIDSFRKML